MNRAMSLVHCHCSCHADENETDQQRYVLVEEEEEILQTVKNESEVSEELSNIQQKSLEVLIKASKLSEKSSIASEKSPETQVDPTKSEEFKEKSLKLSEKSSKTSQESSKISESSSTIEVDQTKSILSNKFSMSKVSKSKLCVTCGKIRADLLDEKLSKKSDDTMTLKSNDSTDDKVIQVIKLEQTNDESKVEEPEKIICTHTCKLHCPKTENCDDDKTSITTSKKSDESMQKTAEIIQETAVTMEKADETFQKVADTMEQIINEPIAEPVAVEKRVSINEEPEVVQIIEFVKEKKPRNSLKVVVSLVDIDMENEEKEKRAESARNSQTTSSDGTEDVQLVRN